jgi:hypothetical protein
MTTELTEDQIKSGKISVHLDIQLPSLEEYFQLQAEKKKRTSKVLREAGDKLTSITREQTALLMYYLQKERVLLKDKYLSDTEIGQAVEILTGFSKDTLRQDVGKFYNIQNHTNLKALNDLLTRLKLSIEKDLAPSEQ